MNKQDKDELLNQGLTQKQIEDLTQKGFSKEEIIQSHQYDNEIKKAYAKYGYCYRIGGDEFCVLLKNCRNEESCSIQFDYLMKSKQRKYNYLPSVSYGSALLLTGDIVSVKDLADQNMYLNKKRKKEQQ